MQNQAESMSQAATMNQSKAFIHTKKKMSGATFFIGMTYLIFWCALLMIGGVRASGASQNVIKGLSILSAWTPTAVFFIFFHQILPDQKARVPYIKGLFQEKRIGRMSIAIILIQTAVFALCLASIMLISKQELGEIFEISVESFFLWFLYTLINGATGEEFGWRGFLQIVFKEKYSIIRGSLMVGIVWSFWHWPLWFISGRYSGGKLLLYVLAFIVGNVSASVIIGICFNRKKNLLIPMLIHFMFNFTVCFYSGDLLILLEALAICYLAGAIIVSLCDKNVTKTSRKG